MSESRAVEHRVAHSTNDRMVAGQKSDVVSFEKRASNVGSTTAKPEIMYSASNWVSAMEKQKAISAAVDRNRRRCETLAATSSDGVI